MSAECHETPSLHHVHLPLTRFNSLMLCLRKRQQHRHFNRLEFTSMVKTRGRCDRLACSSQGPRKDQSRFHPTSSHLIPICQVLRLSNLSLPLRGSHAFAGFNRPLLSLHELQIPTIMISPPVMCVEGDFANPPLITDTSRILTLTIVMARHII